MFVCHRAGLHELPMRLPLLAYAIGGIGFTFEGEDAVLVDYQDYH